MTQDQADVVTGLDARASADGNDAAIGLGAWEAIRRHDQSASGDGYTRSRPSPRCRKPLASTGLRPAPAKSGRPRRRTDRQPPHPPHRHRHHTRFQPAVAVVAVSAQPPSSSLTADAASPLRRVARRDDSIQIVGAHAEAPVIVVPTHWSWPRRLAASGMVGVDGSAACGRSGRVASTRTRLATSLHAIVRLDRHLPDPAWRHPPPRRGDYAHLPEDERHAPRRHRRLAGQIPTLR